jgi:hypothetical protein
MYKLLHNQILLAKPNIKFYHAQIIKLHRAGEGGGGKDNT